MLESWDRDSLFQHKGLYRRVSWAPLQSLLKVMKNRPNKYFNPNMILILQIEIDKKKLFKFVTINFGNHYQN